MNATVYKNHPGVITIAEESTAWPGVTRPTHLGGLGFGFKWNMGWMNDTLSYIEKEPIYRQWHHHQMTFATVYAWSENYILPISHDEVVHGKGSLTGKMPGDQWQKLANTRALLGFMWAFTGKQLLFMGGEMGDMREWSEERGLDWGLLAGPGVRRREGPGQGPQPGVPGDPGAVDAGHVAERLPLDHQRGLAAQHVLVRPLRAERRRAGLHRQLRRDPARGLPHRPAEDRAAGTR